MINSRAIRRVIAAIGSITIRPVKKINKGEVMNLYIRNFPDKLNHLLKVVALEKHKTKEQVTIEILQGWPHWKKYGAVKEEEVRNENKKEESV
jgi:plasmid stability protein